MRLLSLRLEQYRNYGRTEIAFGPEELQVFLGENGSGKTNLLEAIGMLALSKSFLGVDDDDLKQWGTTFYRVTGQAQTDAGEDVTLEVVSQTEPRRAKVCRRNDVKTGIADFVGQLPVAVFLPQDMGLFTGSPGERRKFLDQILSQVSGEYLAAHLHYHKVLKQRNAFLRALTQGLAQREDLHPWDLQLSEAAETIIRLRLELIETFNLTLADEVRSLGEQWTEVTVQYRNTANEMEPGGTMLDALARSLERDLVMQTTSVGPHRDDWGLTVDGRPIQIASSRGQQRAVVLALLFLEASFLELRRGEKPLILLDDIFSELDAHHRERVTAAFPRHQVILTAIEPAEGERVRTWHVTQGSVLEKTAA